MTAKPAQISRNALTVLKHRYLLKDASGNVVETADEMFRRVARSVASGEARYSGQGAVRLYEDRFYRAMASLDFLPNSPTLMNAGTGIGQLAACFVLPVGDSIAEIFEAVRNMALIHQTGGGTGFSFAHLRPRGDVVRETGGVASGPVSFMDVFDLATDIVKQGGRRRGANMGILRVDHPDILEFIHAKEQPGRLTNFNLSVGLTDEFMQRKDADETYPLVNPRTGQVVQTLPARQVWRAMGESAWRTGDPGILFLDEINRHNPTPSLGRIEATNPCGEQPLLPYEACILGSINLAHMAGQDGVDWNRLRETVDLAVRFLDDAIEVGRYPLTESDRITRRNRKIGLGVMGFAELLIQLGVPYASDAAVQLAGSLMQAVEQQAHAASAGLAAQRGSFANFSASIWPGQGYEQMRNAALTTIAPTGTISILANTSSGIEPLFALSYERHSLDGERWLETNPLFQEVFEQAGLWNPDLVDRVATTGTLEGIMSVPADLRRLFQTALEIPAEWHVRIQAAFQQHTDNAVSKTCNLQASASVDDVLSVFELAYRLRCKGVTVFRYGCKGEQVLYLGRIPSMATTDEGLAVAGEFAGDCRICSA
ncbi:MAG TPA: adenosylcobalamin-dependent ribonucleoside-diphosphate reductase [Dehalococcoidia bacterium]|nr:adenosylcobalamin-dependent ribonucleoside-diphosphate reductase [Dehalococcoidia bacterium]